MCAVTISLSLKCCTRISTSYISSLICSSIWAPHEQVEQPGLRTAHRLKHAKARRVVIQNLSTTAAAEATTTAASASAAAAAAHNIKSRPPTAEAAATATATPHWSFSCWRRSRHVKPPATAATKVGRSTSAGAGAARLHGLVLARHGRWDTALLGRRRARTGSGTPPHRRRGGSGAPHVFGGVPRLSRGPHRGLELLVLLTPCGLCWGLIRAARAVPALLTARSPTLLASRAVGAAVAATEAVVIRHCSLLGAVELGAPDITLADTLVVLNAIEIEAAPAA